MALRGLSATVAVSALLLGTVADGTAHPSVGEPSDEPIERYLDAYVEANHVPGLAVAVVDNGEVDEHLRGEDGDGRSVTSQTPFLIGSVAKTMTATVVMELVAEGRLDLDDTVSEHLGTQVDLGDADPTLEQLLTHTAGFSSADGIEVADRYDNDPGAITRAVEDLDHTGTVGDYAYTSADYLVLGAVVEQVTGEDFGSVLRARVLDPVGMPDSQATAAGSSQLPPGHRLWWGHAVRFDPGFDESGTPYASVASTLSDLTRYARAQLGTEPGIPAPVRREMQQPWVASSQDHYGLGWSVTDVDDTQVVHHTGATPGYFSHVLLVPEEGVAVVLLANVYAEARAPSLTAGAQDVWRIHRGEEQEVAEGDAVLTVLPWALSGVALLGLGLAVLSRRRPVRPAFRLAVAAGSISVAVALWLLPGLFGQDLRALRIWVPDAGWSLVAALALWVLAAVAFLLPLARASTPR